MTEELVKDKSLFKLILCRRVKPGINIYMEIVKIVLNEETLKDANDTEDMKKKLGKLKI